MKILAAGGGSGGHVTPVAAVLNELKKQAPDVEIRFWCDKKFAPSARKVMANVDSAIRVDVIMSGKLRRYAAIPLWQQLLTFRSIVLPNIIDSFKVMGGLVQAIVKLMIWRPDVIFTKGGFVCLPIGVAARILRIPLVIHDSDAHPGLTNRTLAKWAQAIATGAPLSYYPSYSPERSQYVGIPISADIAPKNHEQRNALKRQLGLDDSVPLVVVTGGGLGARRINDAVASCRDALIANSSVVLVSGAAQYDELRARLGVNTARFQLHGFMASGMIDMLSAADIVVARAGMTTIFELSALAKPTILIPNIALTGGHQVKNARVYKDADAVEVLDEYAMEANPTLLRQAIETLLASPSRQQALADALYQFAKPHAATDVASILLDVYNQGKKR